MGCMTDYIRIADGKPACAGSVCPDCECLSIFHSVQGMAPRYICDRCGCDVGVYCHGKVRLKVAETVRHSGPGIWQDNTGRCFMVRELLDGGFAVHYQRSKDNDWKRATWLRKCEMASEAIDILNNYAKCRGLAWIGQVSGIPMNEPKSSGWMYDVYLGQKGAYRVGCGADGMWKVQINRMGPREVDGWVDAKIINVRPSKDKLTVQKALKAYAQRRGWRPWTP